MRLHCGEYRIRQDLLARVVQVRIIDRDVPRCIVVLRVGAGNRITADNGSVLRPPCLACVDVDDPKRLIVLPITELKATVNAVIDSEVANVDAELAGLGVRLA